jgi:DnaJ-class molecular chaperone
MRQHLHRCPVCGGTGRVWCTPDGTKPTNIEAGRYHVCRECNGAGYIVLKEGYITSFMETEPADKMIHIDPVREVLLMRLEDLQASQYG